MSIITGLFGKTVQWFRSKMSTYIITRVCNVLGSWGYNNDQQTHPLMRAVAKYAVSSWGPVAGGNLRSIFLSLTPSFFLCFLAIIG